MTDTKVMTPRHSETDERLKIRLSLNDYEAVPARGTDWGPVDVVDLDTGIKYRMRPAPCGAGCHCDATAEPIGRTGH